MDAGKSAVKTAGNVGSYGLNKTAAGIGIKTWAEGKFGWITAPFRSEFREAEKGYDNAKRFNEIGDYTNKLASGDPKAAKEMMKRRDKDLIETLVRNKEVSEIKDMMQGAIDKKPDELEKVRNKQGHDGQFQEEMANYLGALKQIAIAPSLYGQEKSDEARRAMKGLEAKEQVGLDSYGNFWKIDKPTNSIFNDSKDADFWSSSFGISPDQKRRIVQNPSEIPNVLSELDPDHLKSYNAEVKSYFASQNMNPNIPKEQQINNLSDLLKQFSQQQTNQINDNSQKHISVHQNIPFSQLENLLREIKKPDKDGKPDFSGLDNAKNIADKYNLTQISNQITTLINARNAGTEDLSKYSFDSYILNETVQKFHDTRQNFDNYINSNPTANIQNLRDHFKNTTENLIVNNISNFNEQISQMQGHNDIAKIINNNNPPEDNVLKIIQTDNASNDYISKLFEETPELIKNIENARKNATILEPSLDEGRLDRRYNMQKNDLDKIRQQIQENKELLQRKFLVYNK